MAQKYLIEYKARINAVMDYIQNNLHKPLSLNELARVANFSPYHFHRIFSSIVGETLNSFIQRLRIEKAASMLKANPKKSITEIALDYGFSSSASFARLFKETYRMSASLWRSGGYEQFSKIGKTQSKIGKTVSNDCKEQSSSSQYFSISNSENGGAKPSNWMENFNYQFRRTQMSLKPEPTVEVKTIPAFSVAYIRHIGPYKGNDQLFKDLLGKLMTWAGPRGLLGQPDLKVICAYHDEPEITDEQKLRISLGISVPKDFKVDGEFGKMEISEGKYAVDHFEINSNQFQDAWDYICGEWLPQSGYQMDDGLCYELYLNDPAEHPENKHIVDIHVPIKPL
mgnify:CR=1 FL=1